MTVMVVVAISVAVASIFAAFVGVRHEDANRSSAFKFGSRVTISVDGKQIDLDLSHERVASLLLQLNTAPIADEIHSLETMSYKTCFQPVRKPINISAGTSDPSLKGEFRMAG